MVQAVVKICVTWLTPDKHKQVNMLVKNGTAPDLPVVRNFQSMKHYAGLHLLWMFP